MKELLLKLLALFAAYAATPPQDNRRIADLHRKKAKLVEDNDLSEEEVDNINRVVRLHELASPTEEARVAAAESASFLDEDGDGKDDRTGKPAGEAQQSEPQADAPSADFEAGAEAARNGSELPNEVSDEFQKGYDSVSEEERA